MQVTYHILMRVHEYPKPPLLALLQHPHNIVHVRLVVLPRALMFERLPREYIPQEVVAPCAQSREVHIRRSIIEVQGAVDKVAAARFGLFPEPLGGM